jgi:maltose O-acetyltransferase
LINGVASVYWLPKRLRLRIYRIAGLNVSLHDVTMFSGSIIRTRRLRVERGVFVNHGCFFGDAPITLRQDVFVGVGVVFASSDHEVGDKWKRAGPDRFEPIEVGRGTWIGARSVVLAGVTIAPGCIIGAGAVVTRDTEPNGVYAGVPARRMRELRD